MAQAIPEALRWDINAGVLAHVEQKSAHSDVADELTKAVKPLGDVQINCPDWRQYRYVVVSTGAIIFGCATGMDTVAFRLDARMRERAHQTGAERIHAIGSDWMSFILFRDDWPKVDLQFWALKAYVYARETAAQK